MTLTTHTLAAGVGDPELPTPAAAPRWMPGLLDHDQHLCTNPAPEGWSFTPHPISACGAMIIDMRANDTVPWRDRPHCLRCETGR